jgi:hypothetical protein
LVLNERTELCPVHPQNISSTKYSKQIGKEKKERMQLWQIFAFQELVSLFLSKKDLQFLYIKVLCKNIIIIDKYN